MISNIPIMLCFKVFKIFFIKITKYISKNQFLLEVQMLKSSRWWSRGTTVSQADGGAGDQFSLFPNNNHAAQLGL